MPEFPGGEDDFFSLIAKNVIYPNWELKNDVEGRVIVGFIIYEDGSIHDVNVQQSLSPGLDKEAVRVIEMLPSFLPGKENGKEVKVKYLLPIMFKLIQEIKN